MVAEQGSRTWPFGSRDYVDLREIGDERKDSSQWLLTGPNRLDFFGFIFKESDSRYCSTRGQTRCFENDSTNADMTYSLVFLLRFDAYSCTGHDSIFLGGSSDSRTISGRLLPSFVENFVSWADFYAVILNDETQNHIIDKNRIMTWSRWIPLPIGRRCSHRCHTSLSLHSFLLSVDLEILNHQK